MVACDPAQPNGGATTVASIHGTEGPHASNILIMLPMRRVLRFDSFEVDLAAGQLHKRGARVHLREQSFQVLAALLERPGDVISRDELRRRLWPDDVFVDFENGLNTAVARLRDGLDDSADHPRYIETLPKRGYRFVGPVMEGDGSTGSRTAAPPRPRLIVLPFANWSNDAAREYLADAVTDEIITALAALAPDKLAVMARTTAMHYKATRKTLAAIARDVGVDYVVEGGLRGSGGALALNVQLIRGSDGSHLWARRFDVDPNKVFDLQYRIARDIGDELDVAPPAVATPTWKKPTADLTAYTLYQQGRQQMARGTPEGVRTAKTCYEQAIARDPGFALAYDALAELYWYLGFFGFMPAQAVTPAGLFNALRALDLDDTLAETHALLGLYRKERDFNWADVKHEMDRALELNPTSPIVRVRHAMGWLLSQGRLGEAAAEIEAALETDPLSVFMRVWLGCMLWLDRRYDLALEQARMAIDIEPDNFLGHWHRGLYLRDAGRHDESIAAHRRALELSGGSLLVLGWLGLALGQGGRRGEAEQVLQQLESAASAGAYVPPTSVAWTLLGLGRIAEAFTWMDRAVDGCDHMLMPLQFYPFLDPFRTDPRYLGLMRRLQMNPAGGVLLDT